VQSERPRRRKHIYHGWITVYKHPGKKDTIKAEYSNDGQIIVGIESEDAEKVIEWWDNFVGQRINLVQFGPLPAFRVYTYEL